MPAISQRLLNKWKSDGPIGVAASVLAFPLRAPLRFIRNRPFRQKYDAMLSLGSRGERFAKIYEQGLWKTEESLSGAGSDLSFTANIREELPALVKRHGFERIVDVGCGDNNWINLIREQLSVEYTGLDIVPSVIAKNRELYADEKTRFEVADAVQDPLPACDLIMARDVIFHLSFADIDGLLENLQRTQFRYLLTTSHMTDAHFTNRDIQTGDFRNIDLFKPPFGFDPAAVVEEFEDHPPGFAHPRRMVLIAKDDVPAVLSQFA